MENNIFEIIGKDTKNRDWKIGAVVEQIIKKQEEKTND